MRFNALAFIDSQTLRDVAPLSNKVRDKPIVTLLDLEIIVRAIWDDKQIFHTNRMKTQCSAVCLLSTLSSERPGAIMVSDCYRETNEAMTWGDCQFMLFPNPDDPHRPLLGIMIGVDLQKGYRKDPSKRKFIFLWPEPQGNRANCAATLFCAMAQEDDIFEHVRNIQEAVYPENPCTSIHVLTLKQSSRKQPIFRAEVLTPRGWEISSTAALKVRVHRMHLQRVCFFRGFSKPITDYAFRRRTAKNLSGVLSEDDRNSMMSQVADSHQYRTAYQSMVNCHDLGAILHRRESAPAIQRAMEAASGISINLDSNAPTRLTVEEREELRSAPQFVALRAERDDFRRQVDQESLKLPTFTSPEAIDTAQAGIAKLRKDAANAQRKIHNLEVQETRVWINAKRVKHFDGHSGRQISGQAPPAAPPLSTVTRPQNSSTLKENAGIRAQLDTAFVDPIAELIEILYDYPEADVHDELIACVDALVGLPERRFHPCYPGESPNQQGNCPVCDKTPTDVHVRMGEHIHDCHSRDFQQQAQSESEDNFTAACQWDGCRRRNRTFTDRTKFIDHVQDHVDLIDRASSSVSECKWLEGDEICGADNCLDWKKHYGQLHSTSLYLTVPVHYCVICSQWFVDEYGDGLEWDAHCWEHYQEVAAPYQVRVEQELDIEPIGVVFVDGCVEFDHATGFDGSQPDLHGHSSQGVVSAPAFCCWCIFNQELEIDERMRQWTKQQHFRGHLEYHANDLDQDAKHPCPVPSCGTKRYTLFEFKTHLVAVHRLPICGSTSHTVVRRLKLPVAPSETPTPSVDLTHAADFLPDADPAAASGSNDAPAPLQLSPMRKGKKRKKSKGDPPVRGHC
ncbi:hypothetical protein B0H11DRAFT_1791320, partial [Mycena galericulata]